MKIQTVIFAALSLLPPSTFASPDGDLLTGRITCDALDAALAAHDDKFFDGWTDSDFHDVKTTVDPNLTTVCRRPGMVVLQLPATVRRDKALDEQRVRTLARNADAQSVEAREAAVANANARAAAAKLETCRESTASKLFVIQQNLIRESDQKAGAEADLTRQNRIGEVSGAVDMTALHRDGEIIVRMEDDMARDWKEYQSLGGRANAPAQLSRSDSDPCY